jgi:flagellar biosynthesis protein FlhF
MKIKKYVAKTMREALIEIRNELGDSAIILKTRKLPGKGFPFSGADIEVTAAIDDGAIPQPAFPEINVKGALPLCIPESGVYNRPRSSCIVDTAEPVAIKAWRPPIIKTDGHRGPPQPETIGKEEHELTGLKEDIRQLADLVKSVVKNGGKNVEGGFNGGWGVLYKRLVDSEVKPVIAAHMIERMVDGEAELANGGAEEKMVELLKSHFPSSGPIKCKKNGPRIVAFVGPTGAGKTTTIAKLVAHCCLGKKRSVSIITADTYRIAAIEQIRTFADIVKVRLHVVFTPAEVKAALAACVNDDLVFIDTAGRSRRETDHLADLKTMLGAIHPDEIHCVVSATTKDSDLKATVERYGSIGANRLLFTKLDETMHVGNVFNTISETRMPASFFTFGQSVPDDIELAQPARFVQRLWEETTA